ncbi:MAG: hypothetical protein HC879_12210 [Leptolyngbyaceae cyanobacterium SL_5_9]|nr:hypothetical protein [Leptolyngbyaceae cyanobacterium SL_5_9]NJO73304.1 hypothetical protein [Leptolyngbyaceae cyanobacterium RM1_406_9]
MLKNTSELSTIRSYAFSADRSYLVVLLDEVEKILLAGLVEGGAIATQVSFVGD